MAEKDPRSVDRVNLEEKHACVLMDGEENHRDEKERKKEGPVDEAA